MTDWRVTLSFTAPYPVRQETAQALWGLGDHFTSLPGARTYQWAATASADTIVAAAEHVAFRLASALRVADMGEPEVFAMEVERLHPLRSQQAP
ncbi:MULTISPECIES: hypothetical protein [unclassified Streptomyces]|uniref:hypothetical protein n=1 Tax=unclassified Streptomyces TaxID=2593676 RepID=UPI0004BFF83F|nr:MULTISPECIES: hypothetical protein [unclassified Streptomyces]